MIRFKQTIGRGTRLYEGKDYFTIYDFVKIGQHFNNPNWDSGPQDPNLVTIDGQDDKTPPNSFNTTGGDLFIWLTLVFSGFTLTL